MRSLISLSVVTCLLVVEVLSDGTRSLGAGGLRGLVWGRAAGEGAVCWGPGVWPHPSHCRMFSVCHVANESTISGMLLMCPPKMAFSTRRGRCLNDRNRCSEKPLPEELLNSTEMYQLSTASQRNYRCRSPRPFCRNNQTLTVCAPNFSLIGNVTCSGGCKQENGVATCFKKNEETESSPATIKSVAITTVAFESTRLVTTTAKYDPPVLDADLIDSAIKITSALGLNPGVQEQQNPSNIATSKPIKHETKPGLPAYTAPVFDFSSPQKEESSETGQSAEGGNTQFSKPVVVEPSKHSITKKPEGNGNADSQIITVEMVQPVESGVTTYRPKTSSTESMKEGVMDQERIAQEEEERRKVEEMEQREKDRLDKEKLEKERLEKERLEKEKLEKERLEKERLEKERLEKERLEKERLEKERLEKERLEKERLEKEKLEKERLEKERLEKEKLEKERLEKERLEKERLEKERLEKEKLEKERLEKERLEKERLEKEKLEKERLEKERLEKERLEKERLEKERLEKERLEKERLEKEKLEKERLEKERLEKERLEKEKLEKERLEKEKLQKERLEKERLERERLEKERLEKERLEKEELEKERLKEERLEKERLEQERLEMEQLEKERLEKLEKEEREKLEQERLEKERLELEKQEAEMLNLQKQEDLEKWQKENEKYNEDLEKLIVEQSTTGVKQMVDSSYFSGICRQPGLVCANSNTLVECSSGIVPVRAWDCGAFFARSATLMAKCEKDSCLATVDEGLLPSVDETVDSLSASRLCDRPGAQCADTATLLHCSDDLKTATVVVCEDLFPRDAVGAVCDATLEACVVGLEGNEGEYISGPEAPIPSTSPEASLLTKTSQATTPMGTVKFTARPTETSTVAAKPTLSIYQNDEDRRTTSSSYFSLVSTTTYSPKETIADIAYSNTTGDCNGPGLRCSGGQFLEACEKRERKPVYKMDCSSVVAHSIDARCEEHSSKEAVCMVTLQRSDGNNGEISESEDTFTLELSVVDVTKTYGGSDGDIASWNCSSIGQYCADDSTLLSCNADYSLEFALSCGAIAPESVVAYCDYYKNACVVKKMDEISSDVPHMVALSNGTLISQGTTTQLVDVHTHAEANIASVQDDEYNSEAVPDKQQWDFSTISQLYPPDIPQNAYGVSGISSSPPDLLPTSYTTTEMADTSSLPHLRVCVENGPVCLDDYHLGYCSRELELQYALPCSALYSGDSEAFCDRSLSACLPSTVKRSTTVAPTSTTTTEPITTTTEAPSTTTTRPIPPTLPPFLAQQILSNQNFPPQSIPQPVLQDTVLAQPAPAVVQPVRPTRPGLFQFFQRPPGNRPGIFQQPPRIPGFLQNIIQNFGVRPITQAIRPGLFGSQASRPSLGSLPVLGNLFQGAGAVRPVQPIFQGVTPEGEEYNFEDPQYVHPGAPTSYGKVPFNRFGLLQVQENAKTPVPLISPDFYHEILKHASKQQQTTPQNVFLGLRDQRPVTDRPQQSYFDRVMMNIAQNVPTPEHVMEASKQNFVHVEPDQKYRPGDTNGNPSSLGTNKVVQATVGSQGTFSPVNPLTWVDKVNFDEKKPQRGCKRPGMQCMDSDSLGACSEDLRLQYVIPCKNLLPFIAVGKAYCDDQNDACGVLSLDESPEYPTDYTSYP